VLPPHCLGNGGSCPRCPRGSGAPASFLSQTEIRPLIQLLNHSLYLLNHSFKIQNLKKIKHIERKKKKNRKENIKEKENILQDKKE
jgi:hypothetical protein